MRQLLVYTMWSLYRTIYVYCIHIYVEVRKACRVTIYFMDIDSFRFPYRSSKTSHTSVLTGYSQGRNARISLSLSHLPTGGQTALPVSSATTTPEHHVTVSGAVGTVIQMGCARGSSGDGYTRWSSCPFNP